MTYSSPCGRLILGEVQGLLIFCDWAPGRNAARVLHRLGATSGEGSSSCLLEAVSQLDEYFSGIRMNFDLPLRFIGTSFRLGVWQSLDKIEYGHTLSYASFTSLIGQSSSSVRAVASAVGANPFSIVLPCHRIVGSDGALRGYAGGLAAKRYLLDLEVSHSAF